MTTLDYGLVPFRRWHVDWLLGEGEPRPDQTTLLFMERLPNSWTAVLNGDPLACGGTIEQWPGRHMAWMYLHKDTGRHMTFLTRKVLEGLAKVKGRVEMTVRCDFEKGHRWARILGFQIETPVMQAYGPFGENHTGYVRLNG